MVYRSGLVWSFCWVSHDVFFDNMGSVFSTLREHLDHVPHVPLKKTICLSSCFALMLSLTYASEVSLVQPALWPLLLFHMPVLILGNTNLMNEVLLLLTNSQRPLEGKLEPAPHVNHLLLLHKCLLTHFWVFIKYRRGSSALQHVLSDFVGSNERSQTIWTVAQPAASGWVEYQFLQPLHLQSLISIRNNPLWLGLRLHVMFSFCSVNWGSGFLSFTHLWFMQRRFICHDNSPH